MENQVVKYTNNLATEDNYQFSSIICANKTWICGICALT